MSFPPVNQPDIPSPDPVDVPVAGLEGNVMDPSSHAFSPLFVPSETPDRVMASSEDSSLSSKCLFPSFFLCVALADCGLGELETSGPLFVNLDTGGTSELPVGVNREFQPVVGEGITGVLSKLYVECVRVGREVDWKVVGGVYQLRNISSNNHQVAALGQCLGTPSPSGGECTRCARGVGVFSTCRVVSFVDDTGKGTVISLGACMCCHFAGGSKNCSLRESYPAWSLAALRVHVPSFSPPSASQQVSSPSTPRSSSRISRFVERVRRRASASPSPSPLAQVEEGSPMDEDTSESPSVDGVGKYSTVLTQSLFDAGADARLAMELRLRRELAQMQLNVQLIQRDLAGLESLRRREELASASPGAEVDPCWSEFVEDV